MNTRTTGSAGPQRRGLSLLTFLFGTRWHSFVMNTRTTRKQGEQRSPCFLVVEIGYKRVIFLQDLPAKAIGPYGFRFRYASLKMTRGALKVLLTTDLTIYRIELDKA